MSRATQIERIIAKGQLVPFAFTQDALAASQTDAQLNIIETAATSGTLGVTEYITPWEGEIIGISVLLEGTAATAGTLTVGPTVGGTEKTALTQTLTTGKEARATVLRGSIPFAAGDNIGCEITTDASWDGTGLDLVALVWTLLYLEGI